MGKVLRFLSGWQRVRITGATPADFLNLLAKERIRFWDVVSRGEMELHLSVGHRDGKKLPALAVRAGCDWECIGTWGLPQLLRHAGSRPLLLLSLMAAIFFTFYLQSFVWILRVEGNETVSTERILQVLSELGIGPGTKGVEIDGQLTKNRVLLQIPELAWLAVNRSGFLLSVPVTEADLPHQAEPRYPAAHIVACRDGVLTQVSVLEGMRLCAVGDSVRAGQILVSGFEDYGLCLRGVQADGEIFAQTWHTGTVVTPASAVQKRYTGETWKEISLIIGRKRINLCSGSSISTPNCDKMINVEELTLPGGETLPIRLEIVTCRQWEPVCIDVEKEAAEQLLLDTWNTLTNEAMVAGTIENTRASILASEGLYVLQAESTCHEMIARVLPAEAIYKGETYE